MGLPTQHMKPVQHDTVRQESRLTPQVPPSGAAGASAPGTGGASAPGGAGASARLASRTAPSDASGAPGAPSAVADGDEDELRAAISVRTSIRALDMATSCAYGGARSTSSANAGRALDAVPQR